MKDLAPLDQHATVRPELTRAFAARPDVVAASAVTEFWAATLHG
jgi:hypothetical protein